MVIETRFDYHLHVLENPGLDLCTFLHLYILPVSSSSSPPPPSPFVSHTYIYHITIYLFIHLFIFIYLFIQTFTYIHRHIINFHVSRVSKIYRKQTNLRVTTVLFFSLHLRIVGLMPRHAPSKMLLLQYPMPQQARVIGRLQRTIR